jgi:hypothetical protein
MTLGNLTLIGIIEKNGEIDLSPIGDHFPTGLSASEQRPPGAFVCDSPCPAMTSTSNRLSCCSGPISGLSKAKCLWYQRWV